MTDRSRPGIRTTRLPDGFEDATFALCLTHDVDRLYKTIQAPYLALRTGESRHLRELLTEARPYWCVRDIMELEESLDVRSSFYFLNEQRIVDLPLRRWLNPFNWLQFTGHYRITDPEVVDIIHRLDRGGWEVGIHGSYESFYNEDRFAHELDELEDVLESEIVGGRQHFLNLNIPNTWQIHREHGLQYDTSLGSSTTYGFDHGYDVRRPFDDDFLVFPLTVMEITLLAGGKSVESAKRAIDKLVEEAATNGAVMTALWHVRLFNEQDFPGYRQLYRYLIERATEAGAWIGPVAEAHRRITDAPSDRPVAR